MTHNCNRTGCPHCDPEMLAIVRDSHAGRWESLANRMDAITLRTLRAHNAKLSHPAYRALRSRAVKSPTVQDFVSALEMARNRGKQFRASAHDRLAALLAAAQSKPTTTTHNSAQLGSVPTAPDLTAAIRAARKE